MHDGEHWNVSHGSLVTDWSSVPVVEMRSPHISPLAFLLLEPCPHLAEHSSPCNWRHDSFSNTRFPLRGRVYRPVDFRQHCIPACISAHSDHTLISNTTLMWRRCRAQEHRRKADWRDQNPTHYSSFQHSVRTCSWSQKPTSTKCLSSPWTNKTSLLLKSTFSQRVYPPGSHNTAMCTRVMRTFGLTVRSSSSWWSWDTHRTAVSSPSP